MLGASIARGGAAALLLMLLYPSAAENPGARGGDHRPTGPIMVGIAGEAPVAAMTLDDAVSKARAMHRVGHGEPVTIDLPSGTFRLDQALKLGPMDSDLVIRGAADGGTILSGATSIVARPMSGAPVKVDLAGRLGHPVALSGFAFGQVPKVRNPLVFQGDKRIEFAAWPNGGYATGWTLQSVPGGMLLTYPKGAVPTLPSSVLVGGYLLADWAYEVERGQPRRDGILLPGYQPQFPPKSPPRLRVLNVPAALVPGRMALDEASGQLTIDPPQDGVPIDLAIAPSVLAISGAHDVRIERVRFEKTTDTAIIIDHDQRISFDQCSVGLTGGSGVMINASTDVTVQHCVLRGLGAAGIQVIAGDRTTLAPGNVAIRDSVIEQYAMDLRTYQPGVGLSGVGNLVEHSIVAGAPHTGMMIGGNEQTVSANEVTAVACETEDVGAVYMGRDWTMRGMRIDGNFIHDTGNGKGGQPIGVYLDDQFSGVAITRNVFLRVGWGVLLGGGRDNRIDDNAFALMSEAAIHYDARGLGPQRAQAAPGGTLMTKFLQSPYGSVAWRVRYPALAGLPSDHPGAPIGNRASGNRLILSPWLKGGDGGFPLGGAPGQITALPASALSGPVAGQYAALSRLIGGDAVGPRGPLLFDRYRLSAPSCSAAGP